MIAYADQAGTTQSGVSTDSTLFGAGMTTNHHVSDSPKSNCSVTYESCCTTLMSGGTKMVVVQAAKSPPVAMRRTMSLAASP